MCYYLVIILSSITNKKRTGKAFTSFYDENIRNYLRTLPLIKLRTLPLINLRTLPLIKEYN